MIPYGRQSIDEDDIAAAVNLLRSDWLTKGPKVVEFERAFAKYVGSQESVAVSNGTAALHAAMCALEIGLEDELIVPAMNFASTANLAVLLGGTPIFCDLDPDTKKVFQELNDALEDNGELSIRLLDLMRLHCHKECSFHLYFRQSAEECVPAFPIYLKISRLQVDMGHCVPEQSNLYGIDFEKGHRFG